MHRWSKQFKSKEVIIDGIKFKSTLEGVHYKHLKLLLNANKISKLETQPKFNLMKGFYSEALGQKVRGMSAKADFYFYDNEKEYFVILEIKSKGTITEAYKMRKKLILRWLHDNNIRQHKFVEIVGRKWYK